MESCFDNNGYCIHMETVEVEPEIEEKPVPRSNTSWSCAWCTLHNCSCKSKNYYCNDYKKAPKEEL